MATLVSQSIAPISGSGTVVTYGAVAASDTFPATAGRTRYHVNNAGASPDTVTFTVTASSRGGLVATSKAVVVTNGTQRTFLMEDDFIDSNGNVTVTHSFTTGVLAGVFN